MLVKSQRIRNILVRIKEIYGIVNNFYSRTVAVADSTQIHLCVAMIAFFAWVVAGGDERKRKGSAFRRRCLGFYSSLCPIVEQKPDFKC